jgi:hypothetical protein
MSSYEHLDALLGEALECIIEAAGEVREIIGLNKKESLMSLGRATSELWKVRDGIYSIRPELKRDFVQEREQDKVRYEKLGELHNREYAAERTGQIDSAIVLYGELLNVSCYGFFRLVAEAALYRLSQAKRP